MIARLTIARQFDIWLKCRYTYMYVWIRLFFILYCIALTSVHAPHCPVFIAVVVVVVVNNFTFIQMSVCFTYVHDIHSGGTHLFAAAIHITSIE